MAETIPDYAPDVAFRMACIVQTAELLREAIARNGDKYHGSLVPNIQSVEDIPALPFSMLVEQVAMFPPLVERLRMAGFWPPPQGAN